MNKKTRMISIIFIISILLISCHDNKSNNDDDKLINNEKTEFIYNYDNIIAFCTDFYNNIYFSYYEGSGIKCYDESGNYVREYPLGSGAYTNLCIYNRMLYCYDYNNQDYISIDLDSGEKEVILHDEDTLSIVAMEVFENHLYMIRRSHSNIKEFMQFDDRGYVDMGEELAYIDIDTGNLEILPFPNVKLLTKHTDNSLYIYAYDLLEGFYLADYNILYNNILKQDFIDEISIISMDYNPITDELITCYFGEFAVMSCSNLKASSRFYLSDYYMPQTGNDLKYENGYIYIIDNNYGMGPVIRIHAAAYIKDNIPLKAYTYSVASDFDQLGYRVDRTTLSEEEMALRLMAGGDDFDFIIMKSEMDAALNMLQKGAYYPLNKAEGISAYLDAAFDYIKDAATDNDGNIWMLPLRVDSQYIVYNPDNLATQGIHIQEGVSFYQLTEYAGQLYEKEDLRNKYSLNYFQMVNTMISQYVEYYAVDGNNVNFDTELFRNLCMFAKEYYMHPSLQTWVDKNAMLYELLYSLDEGYYHEHVDNHDDINNGILYGSTILLDLFPKGYSSQDRLDMYSTYEGYRAIAIPKLADKENENNSVICEFLLVNPKSEHLNEALEFVSELSATLSKKQGTNCLKDIKYMNNYDQPLVKDVYKIYTNSKVAFEMPKEVFWDIYTRYLFDEILLDTFIEEAERKVRMYLYE